MRFEVKALFVLNNPLLYQLEHGEQFELQARFVVFVF